MKKLLFAAYSLDVGGIEKALVNLVNVLQNRGYDITVVLEKKQGIFLNELNKNIKLIEYTPSEKKNLIVRKITNFIHRIQFIIKSIFVSKVASKNNTLWGHADYLTLFDNDRQKVKDFFKSIKVEQFKNIIFVSEEGKNSFLDIFPQMKEKTIECNNIVNNKEILKLSEEEIEIKKDNKCFTFLNVGRHDEKQKKLTRILFVGDGKDNTLYRKMVKDKKLENNIIFVGPQKNPYPYFKISDCVILTSDYEGYPVVFLESFILNKPIITTKVSDYKDIEGKYGYITSKQIDDIYEKMKEMIKNGYEIKESFDADKYNNDIIEKLEKIF